MGTHALLVLLDDTASARAAARLIVDLASECGEGALPVPEEVVPAARTVLVDGLADSSSIERWRSRLAAIEHSRTSETKTRMGTSHMIEASYDGPDLAVVAAAWGCSPEAVVSRHQQTRFVVAFCGFAPGFAYCVGESALPEVPRRTEPREHVPAGSVALAGEYCGIYPAAMPGGWQVIGLTRAVLFDAHRAAPALLEPGDSVHFRALP